MAESQAQAHRFVVSSLMTLRRRLCATLAVGVFVVVGGCTAASSVPPSAMRTATSSPIPTDTASPLPSLPAELVGEWETDLLEFHEHVCLECVRR